MPRQIRVGGRYKAHANMTTCPGCGSYCSTTEANRAHKLINGEALEDLSLQLTAANLRISALEAEISVAKRLAERKPT